MTIEDNITGPAFAKPSKPFLDDFQVAKWVKKTVHRMDCPSGSKACDFSDPEIQRSLVLVASFVVGADEWRIASILGIDPKLVCFWGDNLRKNGVWLDDGKIDVHWFHPQSGKFGFTIDSLVASGRVVRVGIGKDGLPRYKADLSRHISEAN